MKPRWTEIELEILASHTDKSVAELAGMLPNRTRNAIGQKLKSLNLFNKEMHYPRLTKIGDVFSRLTVIGFKTKDVQGHQKTFAVVQCECINKTVKLVNPSCLQAGSTKSCGCLHRESVAARLSKARRKTDMTVGKQFGRWTIIAPSVRRLEGSEQVEYALCRCSCNGQTERHVRCTYLRKGRSSSCGCLANEEAANRKRTHGKSGSTLYKRWLSIKKRCSGTIGSCKHYGGRGIKVCEEWQEFEPFEAWALANGFRAELEIDRIDGNGNYEPSNCRWVDHQTQVENRKVSVLITYQGETKCASRWARDTRCEVSSTVLIKRIRAGEPFETARLKRPQRRRRSSKSE